MRQRSGRAPSPIFLGLLAAAIASGAALWAGIGSPALFAFLFILTAWIVSLCLHEFAHAAVAYRYGDVSVLHRGYLTLDPLRYTHLVYSLVLPIAFLLLGGIGLPGGAVFIDRRALRSRLASSAVSAAGPLSNLAIAVLLSIAFALRESNGPFWAAIAFLLFLQVTAAVLNLLPVPGLDGFGVVQPYLPGSWLRVAATVSPYAVLVLFVLLWIPAVNAAFFSGIQAILGLLGVPGVMVGAGFGLFRFWM